MFSAVLDRAIPDLPQAVPAHVLLVVPDRGARDKLADALLEAGFWVTVGSTFGLGTTLRDGAAPINLVVTALPMAELGNDAIRLARAVAPDVPLLMLEDSSASGPGVVTAVHQMLRRWPVEHTAA